MPVRERGRVAVLVGAVLLSVPTACTPDPPDESEGWLVTTYYTPVEQFHTGDPVAVRGHPDLESEAEVDLGAYPSGFVDAVRDEGCGRITSGPHAGQYLNWSWDTGYWLDTSTRDTSGDPLVPFETAAVDGVARGTPLRLVTCGQNDDSSPAEAEVCARLSAANWVVRDEFTPGFGGDRHVDLYLGEQDRPDLDNWPLWITWSDGRVALG